MRLASAALAATLVWALTACDDAPPLVLTGGGLIDGAGNSWERGRLVVIDGRVACAGAVEDCEAPPGADVLESDGFWIIPGLIDVDIGVEPGPPNEQLSYLRFLLGVTTAGNPDAGQASERGPGPIFDPDAGSAFDPDADRTLPLATGSDDRRIPVPRETDAPSGPSLFGVAVRAAAPGDADGPAPRDTREYGVWLRSVRWTSADPDLLADSARAFGARRARFAPRLVYNALWAGPYRLPHGLNPLLELPLFTERIQDRIVPDRTREEAGAISAGVEVLRNFVHDFHEAGGRLATASAGALAPGLAIHEEMRALVESGLSPEEAIYAATRESAALLGLSDSRGTLERGKLADFLIIEGDPRLDIAHTQTISRVAKGGRLYDPATLLDALLDEPGSRISDNPMRMIIAVGALALTLFLFGRGVLRHRRSLGPRLVP